MNIAGQTMVNRYTRTNTDDYVEKWKEAYRVCRKKREIMKKKIEEIQQYNATKKHRKFYKMTKKLTKYQPMY
jgi:predicted transcriptional regulator